MILVCEIQGHVICKEDGVGRGEDISNIVDLNIMNKIGPRTLPCGTPVKIFCVETYDHHILCTEISFVCVFEPGVQRSVYTIKI